MRLGLRMGLNSRQGGGGDLPSLDLAFALDKTLTARKGPTPAFTRVQATSTGSTYIGADKLINYAAANEPRFDHDPATGVCKGLLIEESRTNFITRSEELNDASWTKSQVTVNENTTTSPSGIVDADKVVESTALSIHRIVKGSLSAIAGTGYSVSVYAKADGRRYLYLNAGGFGSNSTFDLESGVVSATQNGTASITNAGNGWWRCVTTGTAATTQTTVVNFQLNTTSTASDSSYTGDGTSGLYLWGAQLEAGAFPTSYIPTTSGTAARSADVCSIAGTDFSSFYNQVEGTLFGDVTPQTVDQLAVVVGVNTTTFQNSHLLYKINSTALAAGKRWVANTNVAGPAQSSLIPTPTDIAVSRGILSYAYKLNDMAFAANGTLIGTDNTGTMPFPAAMRIGGRDDGLQINGHIARIQYFRKRLSNAKLQTLTAP